ncbi:deoxyribose-phosphate aldolase [Methanobacterium movens]|nr:MAG: deoxyribose-phosphate aldolase [Methanobacterium sp.]
MLKKLKPVEKLAKMIDHTNVKADATEEDIRKLCSETIEYGFDCAVVTPTNVSLAYEILKNTPVKVCSVIGFPAGVNTPSTKAFETIEAIENGAEEIDMVMNIGAIKSQREDKLLEDIKSVVDAAQGKVVKVIFETAYLTDAEKIRACVISKKAGADYVKTSTAYGGLSGATIEDVTLMKNNISPPMKIKAAGGIRNLEAAQAMIEAGASKLGTSSGVKIIKEMMELQKKS